jgi:hypothetical protein
MKLFLKDNSKNLPVLYIFKTTSEPKQFISNFLPNFEGKQNE